MISVVIPTLNRPADVQAAVHSALNQTYQDLEVIVVIDGPRQEATEHALRAIEDQRLRVIVNSTNQGLAETRNIGVRASSGEWIAFLDDDDLWFPQKLEKQIQAGAQLQGSHTFVVSQYLEKTSSMERIWPESLPGSTRRFSEYLFCDRGMLVPSTFLVSKALMLDVPFTKGLRHLEDLDWLLRACDDPRTKVGSIAEPLALYNNVDTGKRESEGVAWNVFYVWGVSHRRLFTPLAFALFIVKGVVPRAKEAGASWRELVHLLSVSLLLGSFNPRTVVYFAASSLFTREFKRKVRELFSPAARKARNKARSLANAGGIAPRG